MQSNLVKARSSIVWLLAIACAFGAVWWIEHLERLLAAAMRVGVSLDRLSDMLRQVTHNEAETRRFLADEVYGDLAYDESIAPMAFARLLYGTTHRYGTDATGNLGPELTHLAARRTLAAGIQENNAANLADWIRNAPAVKPGSLMPQLGGDIPNGLTDEQISYIVAYLQSLQ